MRKIAICGLIIHSLPDVRETFMMVVMGVQFSTKKFLLGILFVGVAIAIYFLANSTGNFSRFFSKNNKAKELQASIAENAKESEDILRNVKIENMIGQMIMIGFRGFEAPAESDVAVAVRELNIGGIILFDKDMTNGGAARNIESPRQLLALTNQLQGYAQVPLLIAIDAEGGQVNRLSEKYGFKAIPSAKEVASKGDLDFASKTYSSLAEELDEAGINFNLAPVLDLENSANPIIGKLGRSFSTNPQTVSDYARIFILEHDKKGVATAIKHFPGQGNSTVDNHSQKADMTNQYQSREIEPFETLIKDGTARAVMVSHIYNRRLDSKYPASLSEKFINEILRKMMGFDGVVITDDMQMGILEEFGLKEAIIRSINAGSDIILVSNNLKKYDPVIASRVYNAIYDAVTDGQIPKERIEESYVRIIKLKKQMGIIR